MNGYVYFNFPDPEVGIKEHYEWFEIYNPSAVEITLEGWSVMDTSPGLSDDLPTITIQPGEFVIIAGRTNAFLELHPTYEGQLYEVEDGKIGSGLNRFGDGVILRDATDTWIDAVSYGNSTGGLNPAVPVPPSGSSIERNPANNDTNTRNDWVAQSTPNPGSGNLPTGLQQGDVVEIIFDVEINCDAVSGLFQSAVGFEQPPGTPGTRSGAAFVSINQPDLVVLKSPILQQAGVGDTVTWTVRVENAGFGAADNVTVLDRLGSGLEFVSFSVPPTTLTASNAVWDASAIPELASLPPDEFIEIIVTAEVVACSGLVNRADATFGCSDLVVLANEICSDTRLENQTVTAGIEFIDRFPNVTGSLSPILINYCGGSEVTLFLTNAVGDEVGAAVNIEYTPILPANWTISGDSIVDGVVQLGTLAAGATTNATFTIEIGGPCPLNLARRSIFFTANYTDVCGNPFVGPLLFGTADVIALPEASVTKIMPTSIAADAGSFEVLVEFAYSGFSGTEEITLVDTFPLSPNLAFANISDGGTADGNVITWENLQTGNSTGVLTTRFDVVMSNPCSEDWGQLFVNTITATVAEDCQGCTFTVAGSGSTFPIIILPGLDCGFEDDCGFDSSISVSAPNVDVGEPVTITRTFTNFDNIANWTGMTFVSDLAGGNGVYQSVSVIIDGDDVTGQIAIVGTDPALELDLSGLNSSAYPDPTAIGSMVIEWVLVVDDEGTRIDESILDTPLCGPQVLYVFWGVGPGPDDPEDPDDDDFPDACLFESSKTVSPAVVDVCEPVTLTHSFSNFVSTAGNWNGAVFAASVAQGDGYLDDILDIVVTVNGTDVTAFVDITDLAPGLSIDLAGLNASGFPNPDDIDELVITWQVSVDEPGIVFDVSSLTLEDCGESIRASFWRVTQTGLEIELDSVLFDEACGPTDGGIDLTFTGGWEGERNPLFDVQVILDLDFDDDGFTPYTYVDGSAQFFNVVDSAGDAILAFDPILDNNQLIWDLGSLGTNENIRIEYQLRSACERDPDNQTRALVLYNTRCDVGTSPAVLSDESQVNDAPLLASGKLVSGLQPEVQFLTGTQIVNQVRVLNSCAVPAYNLVVEMVLPVNVAFSGAEIAPTTITSTNVIWDFSTLSTDFGPLVDADGDGFFDDLIPKELLSFAVTNVLLACTPGNEILIRASFGCDGAVCAITADEVATFETIAGQLVTRATFPAAATLCQANLVEYRVRNSGLTINYDVQAFQSFPLGMTYVLNSSEVSINGDSFVTIDDPPGSGTEIDPLQWTQDEIPILAALLPGDLVVIRYEVDLGCEAQLGNSQFVSNGEFTDVCGNVVSNRQVVSVLQINEPVLNVSKTSSRSVADLDQTNLYTIAISHAATSEADVPYMILTDVLPDAVTFAGASVAPDAIIGQTLIWSNDTLNALTPSGVAPYQLGEIPIEIVITGIVNHCAGSVINTATVDYGCSADDICLDASANVSLLTSPRLTPPGLTSQMTLNTCGGTKTVTVTNTGATAHGLFYTEWAPEGFIFTGASVEGEFNSADLIVTYSGIPFGSVATVNFTNETLSGATDIKDDRGDGIVNLDLGQNSGFVVTWTLASAGENLDCLADPTLGNFIDPRQGDPSPVVSSNRITYVDLCGETGSAEGDVEVFPDIPNLDIAIIPTSLIVTNNEVVNMTVTVVNNSETTDADNIHIRVRIDAGWTDVTITGSNIVSSGTTTMLSEIDGNDILLDFPGVILNPLGDRIDVFFTAQAQQNSQSLFMLAEVVGDCGNPAIIPQCTFTNIFGEAPLADTLNGTEIFAVNGQYSSFDQDRFNAAGHFLTKTVRLAGENEGDAGINRPARVGEELIYRITALYFGGEYSNVSITDSLPDQMIFGEPFNFEFDGGLTNAVWDANTGVFTFQPAVISDHPFTFSVDIPVTVTNRIDVQDGITITNIATTDFTLEGVTNTPLPSLTTVDVFEPNLQIVKMVNSNVVQAGDIIIFTNTLSHTLASSTTAYDIVFFDELPPGLVFNAFIQPPDGNAAAGGTTVEFTTNHWDVLEVFTLDDDPIEFVFSALVVDQIIGAPIFNTSQATYKSLDAESFNGNERTGDDGVGDDLNNYATESTVSLQSEAIRDISKIFFSSTQTNTLLNGTTNDFTIGERFIYEIRVDIPQGIATNVVIVDQVPVGWDWVGPNPDEDLSFPGRGYEFFSPPGGPQFPTNVADGLIIIDPDPSFDDSLTDAGSGQWIEFRIPAVTNAADGNLANDFFTLQLEFVALDVPENVGVLPNPTIGTNVVTVQDTHIALGATSTPYRIVEHDIGITKTREPAIADAGDTIFFTLTVTNNANALANAYNILVTDFLDDGLYDLGTLNTAFTPAGWQVDVVPVAGGDEYRFSTIDDTALVPGEAVTVEFNVVLAQAVRPNATYFNVVEVEESSTLYDDPPGGIRDRQDTDDDTVTFNIPGLEISKVLDSTSETEIPDSEDSDVQIGEVLTYRLAITLPESTITNLTIFDTISNNGLAYIGQSARTNTDEFDGILGTLTEDPIVGENVLSDMGQQMTFVFEGNTVVTGGPGTTDNVFSLFLDYLVLDLPENVDGTVHTNFATITYVGNPGNVVTSEVVITTVIEPDVAITKTVDPSENLDAGDIITVTLTLTNSGTASAYDILIEDELELPFFDISTLANETIAAGFTSVVVGTTFQIHSDQTADPELRALMPGSNAVFSFTVELAQELPPNVVFTNVATVVYDSLDDNNIWDEQRPYGDDDEAVLSGSDFEIAKTLWATSEDVVPPDSFGSDVQIGEILTYRIAITVPEGTITNLTLVDTLTPAGLAYIGQSAQIEADDFDGTLGTLVESPLLAVDQLSDSGQQMTFTFEGNTVVDATDGTENNTFFLFLDYLVLDEEVNSGLIGSQTVHTNIVSVTYDGNPNDPVVSDPVTTTVIEPVLGIEKSFSENTVDAGDIVTVTLVVTNSGTATAYDVVIEDDISAFEGDFGSLANITPDVGFIFELDNPILRFLSDPGAAAEERVILAGTAKTFTFDVAMSNSVQPNFTYTNVATVVGDSLSGTNRFEVERITEDEAEDTLDIPDFDIDKELISTSETGPVDSIGSDVQIGEVATYRLTVVIPEGEKNNLSITDLVPDGMAFVVGSVQVDTNDFRGILPDPIVTPDSGLLGADGENVTILFPGTTVVEADVGTEDNIIRITLDLITLNNQANSGLDPQTILTNIAEITYQDNPAPPSRTPPVPVTVVEPDLAITKTVSPDRGDAGDTIQVTLVLTNSGTATAYDLEVSDDLLASIFNIETVANISMPDGFTFEVQTNAPNATVFFRTDDVNSSQPTNALPVGESRTFQFSVNLSQSVEPGQLLTNVAVFQADTIDGTNVFDVDREYEVEDEDVITIDDLEIDKALIGTSEIGPADSTGSNVQIGEVVTYQLTVTLPEGTTPDLTVVDVVPAGMQFVPETVAVDDSELGGTLALPFSVTTAGGPGDQIEILFEGLTIVNDDNDLDNNSFTIDLDLLVLDLPGNTGTVAGAQTILPNFATVAFDGNPPADTSTVVNVEVVEPLLAIQKTMSEASNAVVFVELVVTNSGLATAYDIVIEDLLPVQWWNTTTIAPVSTPDGFTFAVSGAPGDATITYASDPGSGQPTNAIVAGGSVTFRYSAQLIADAPSPVTNVAVVTEYTSIDGDGPEDEQREYGPVEDEDILPIPRVALNKVLTSPTGRPAILGETVTFEIEVTNTGGVGLDPVELVDTFDTTYLGFLDAIGVPDSVVGDTITWDNVGPLPVGVSTTLVVNFEALAITDPGDTTNVVVMTAFTTNNLPLLPQTNEAPVEIELPAALGDFVWFDLNEDGIQDPNEPGVPGVTVNLLSNGTVVATTTTDALGFYGFTNLVPATYVVEFELPDGFVFSPQDADGEGVDGEFNSDADPDTGRTDPVTLESGDVNNNLDAGIYRPLGAIGNYVWLDENSDGFQDAGEPGIPNVRVNLYDATGNLVATTLTDTKGGYLFTDLPGGTYFVDVEDGTDGASYTLPFPGMTQTTTFAVPNTDFGNQDHGTTAIPGGGGLTGYQIDLAPREINLTADFGYNYRPTDEVTDDDGLGAIGDRVWIDANGDGVQDPGELGVPGVTVTLLYDSNGDGTYDTPYEVAGYDPVRITDATGHYMFNDLPSGAYVVVVRDNNFNPGQPLEGYTQTGDPDFFGQFLPPGEADNRTTVPIVLAPGDVFLNADFGYQPPASQNNSVGDRVWFDANANQIGPDGDGLAPGDDNDEYGIAGVTVALIRDIAGNGQRSPGDPIIATTITDANGNYLFTGVPDGNYLVWVNDVNGVLVGLTQTYDSDGIGTPNISAVDLDADGLDDDPVENLEQDFGYTAFGQEPLLGAIGDRVWLDINSDGNQDPNEPGMPGIVMELYDDEDNLIASTITGADGYYYFGGLEPGTYTVVVVTPPPGLDQTYDADDPIGGPFTTPHASTVTIGGTEPLINLDQDFGYVGSGRIGNQVWEDRNADGLFDPLTESGIAGVTLDLYWDLDGTGTVSPGDPKIGTTTTDANGNYLFEGLSVDDGAGQANYIVVVSDRDNVLNGFWKSTGPHPGEDNNSQSDPYAVTLTSAEPENLTADFGYYVDGAALGNRIWMDENADGRQDPDEPGLAGVTVRLQIIYSNGVTNELFTVSDADGFYSFGNLLLDENHNGTNPASPTFILSVINPGELDGEPLRHTPHNAPGVDPWENSEFPLGTVAITWQGQTNVALNEDDPYNPFLEVPPAWYDFGFTPQPTLAVISAVRSRVDDGIAVISWDVALEVNTVGYYLERWTGDEWIRVSGSLIFADPFMPAPNTYEQADLGVALGSTQRYRIVELDGQGRLLTYGPYDLRIDGGEISYATWAAGFDWGDADSSPDADPDGDGLTNWQEYLAGTDPLDANSVLEVTEIQSVAGGVKISWPSAADRRYVIEMALCLNSGFVPVATGIEATPDLNVYVLPVSAEAVSGAFFRVVVE